MEIQRIASVVVDGISGRLPVGGMRGVERLGEPFVVEVSIETGDGRGVPLSFDLEMLLGRTARVTLALDDGGERTVHGRIEDVEQRYAELVLVVGPRVAPLGDAIDHRVFLQLDAVAIAREVLQEHGLDVESRVTRALPERRQCVQAFETGLGFLSRILAEEGITWFVEHENGTDVIVLADAASAYAALAGGALPFVAEAGLVEEECVFDVHLTHALVRDAVKLRDYDFEHPLVNQRVEAKAGPGALPLAGVPGGYREPDYGKVVAALRLEEERARQVVLRGRTNSRRFAVGHTFALSGAPRDDLNGNWMLIEVRWEARDGRAVVAGERRFEAEFVAVPRETPYRPPRAKPPTLAGVQTATVTGPNGSEIHTNALGQTTALLRWDRRRPKDERSSAWIRPLQPQMSGAMFVPRVGWEVLLGFSGTSADTPYVLGRLDNGAAPPAEGLPAKKVRSAFGSRTTPGGGSANVLRMDDAAGQEDMLLNASSNYNERTESAKTVTVNASDRHAIGGNRTHIVGLACVVEVDAAQSTTVGASRSVDVGGAMAFGLGSEAVAVGGARLFDIGGDYSTDVSGGLARVVGAAKIETAITSHNRHVSGAATVLVGGSWNEVGGVASSVGVAGAHLRAAGGPMNVRARACTIKASALAESFGSHTVTARGFVQEKFKGLASLSVGGSASMKGSKVIVKAKTALTIEAAGMTIRLTPGSIDVKGPVDSSVDTKVTGTDKTG